jgi:predicted RNase H-like HicB family nuclease
MAISPMREALKQLVLSFTNSPLRSFEFSAGKTHDPAVLAINLTFVSESGGGADGVAPTQLKLSAKGKTIEEALKSMQESATLHAATAVGINKAIG